MYGCNNFCSYCSYKRWKRAKQTELCEEIIKECKQLVKMVVEVMLLGQNVNSYGKTLDNPITFAQLLQQVEQIEGLRYSMTSHPKDLSDELIEVMKIPKDLSSLTFAASV